MLRINRDPARHLLDVPTSALRAHVLEQPGPVAGRSGFLISIFCRASTRTRMSVAAAAREMGLGHLELPWDSFYGNPRVHGFADHNIDAEMRSLAELGVRAAIVRVDDQAMLELLAGRSSFPVISGATECWHPLQALADLRVLHHAFPVDQRVRVSFLGNGRSPVASSLLTVVAGGRFHVTVVTPSGHGPRPDVLDRADTRAIDCVTDISEGLRDADVVYTDEWFYRPLTADEQRAFAPYRLTEELVRSHAPSARIMHCLPHALEVDRALLYGQRSLVWAQVRERVPSLVRVLDYMISSR